MLTLVDLLGFDSYAALSQQITSYLAVRDLLHLKQTCQSLAHVEQHVWNLNRSLQRYFKDPHGFRRAIRETEAILSGSFVVEFLSRCSNTWQSSNLDVFVGHAGYREAMGRYLVEKEQYIAAKQDNYNFIYNECHVDHYVRGGRHVQVINVHRDPVEHMLRSFYTTCVMNFID